MSTEEDNEEASHTLPVRRLTLYKHGVGFVEREGTVTGGELSLVFRAPEINDALKSLLVLVRGGGQVLGIDYATPADQESRLAESALTLSSDHALLDLLRALRGSAVRLQLGSDAQSRQAEGRLLGVEIAEDAPARRALLTLWDEASGSAAVYTVDEVRQVAVRDERLAGDVRHFLDSSRSQDTRRTVTVRLSPGEHEVSASYLVPSPTWRVSYRLVAEQRTDGTPAGAEHAPASRRGTLLLQGWGIFDNRLEEDLHEVEVRLVAGQPISFVYDLTTSRVPERRVVQDQTRVAPGPVEFERAIEPPGGPRLMRRLAAEETGATYLARMAPAPAAAPAAAPVLQPTLDAMAEQPVVAAGSELGELFQYAVTAPVSVHRGESALVPILSTQAPYARELLFNVQKLRDHPVAALRFANASGLVLERVPVTVVEDGEYRGEAVVPFTRAGGEVYLAFAVELGIGVKTTEAWRTETAGLRIAQALIWTKQARLLETTYLVTSDLDAPEVVTVEHPIRAGYELVDTRPPDAQTADWYRWQVPCPPRRATTFIVTQRTFEWQQQQVLDVSYAALRDYLEKRWLDRRTLDRIRSLLDAKAAAARNERELGELEDERQRIYAREEQLRQNLAALHTAGPEASLRQQVFTQLQASEARLAAIDKRAATLQEQNRQQQAAIDAALETLAVEEAPAAHR